MLKATKGQRSKQKNLLDCTWLSIPWPTPSRKPYEPYAKPKFKLKEANDVVQERCEPLGFPFKKKKWQERNTESMFQSNIYVSEIIREGNTGMIEKKLHDRIA